MVILVLAVLKIDNYHRSLLAPVCVYLFSIVLYFVLSLTHLLKITNRCVCYGKELNAQSRHYMVF